MKQSDRILAQGAWVASLLAVYWLPFGYWLVAATTANLLHERFTAWWAGTCLQDRVRGFLTPDIALWEARLTAMEKDVADVKDAQVRMIGTVRGRQLP